MGFGKVLHGGALKTLAGVILYQDLLNDVKQGLRMVLIIIFLRVYLFDPGILYIEYLAEDFQGLYFVLSCEGVMHLDEGLYHLSDGHVLKRLDDEAKIA